ncbi:alpha/beta fold hydrolase [Brevibacterium sp. CT2-23B]|uniref:alpha/beta fold hydrolase n=1 Tax=Brevibacterium sp. CT2-23B TaxID=2729630 RepID=UPI00155591C3|nr:alpha/beta fold hydrolase [Brevibacterium sp. CT2-23B]
MTEQSIIREDGTTITFGRLGEGAQVITCLHSLGLDGSWYSPLAEEIGGEFTLIAPDFRGHGGSDFGSTGPTLPAIAADVLAIWDHLGIASSPIMGISYGGMVAQALTGTAPDRVSAQILMATSGSFAGPAAEATLGRAAATRSPGGAEEALEPTMHRWFGDEAENPDNPLVARARRQYLDAGAETLATCFESMVTVGDYATGDPPPTLVLGGDDDRSTPRAAVEALAASIDGARLAFVDGGHLVAFDRPHVVAAEILPFLAALD